MFPFVSVPEQKWHGYFFGLLFCQPVSFLDIEYHAQSHFSSYHVKITWQQKNGKRTVKEAPVSVPAGFQCAGLCVRWNGRVRWSGSSSPATGACRQRTPWSSCMCRSQTFHVLVKQQNNQKNISKACSNLSSSWNPCIGTFVAICKTHSVLFNKPRLPFEVTPR